MVLVAVFNVFGSTKQLYIRELTDIQMEGTRCNGGTGQEELMTIAEVRDIFNNGGTEMYYRPEDPRGGHFR